MELINDYLTDGAFYSAEECANICDAMFKALSAANLTKTDKYSIKAQKLAAPIVLNQVEETKGVAGFESGYMDPFLGIKKITSMTYNSMLDPTLLKAEVRRTKKEKREQDALDKQIEEFKTYKMRIPKPAVQHHKSPVGLRDIIISNFTVGIGGKVLLDNAMLRLTKGRRYGLIGRNGIGKTTLLNEMVRKEIHDFPKDLHVASVEQEVDGTDVSVLNTVVACDEERLALLKELKDIDILIAQPGSADTREGQLASKRLGEVHKRLVRMTKRVTRIDRD
jgi:ATP-binding cassette subfamily F protein 3